LRLLLYLTILVILILLFRLLKSFNRGIIATVICSLLILQIVLAPKLCIDAALVGLKLFIEKVFPSLFPFLVITSLMMSYDGVHIYSKVFGKILCKPLRLPLKCTFALVVSILCGYPLGAKYACDLYNQGEIDQKTFQRLLNIATNTSPLFAIGAVGTSMLKSPSTGYTLLLINYISCFLMGIILPSNRPLKENSLIRNVTSDNKNIGNIIKDSIEGAIKTCLSIGGFVIIYSVVISIIKSNILFDIAMKKTTSLIGIEHNIVEGLLLGLIEMTNGCNLIALTDTNMYTKVILISFLLAFSGFSIISQVHSFTYKYDISMKLYIKRKFVQGLLGAATAAVIYKMNIFNLSVTTFNGYAAKYNSFIFIACISLLYAPFLLKNFRRLFHTS
jgi:sporulation integral membrane protein YlbJ